MAFTLDRIVNVDMHGIINVKAKHKGKRCWKSLWNLNWSVDGYAVTTIF